MENNSQMENRLPMKLNWKVFNYSTKPKIVIINSNIKVCQFPSFVLLFGFRGKVTIECGLLYKFSILMKASWTAPHRNRWAVELETISMAYLQKMAIEMMQNIRKANQEVLSL